MSDSVTSSDAACLGLGNVPHQGVAVPDANDSSTYRVATSCVCEMVLAQSGQSDARLCQTRPFAFNNYMQQPS